MKSTLFFTAIAASLLDQALARGYPGETACYTKKGYYAVAPLPTHTYHATSVCTVTLVKTHHPKVTVTPKCITKTRTTYDIDTITSTCNVQVDTDTVTSTYTDRETTTKTYDPVTYHHTVTSTYTTTIGTVYTKKAPGYTAVPDSLPGAWNDHINLAKKEKRVPAGSNLQPRMKKHPVPAAHHQAKHPVLVDCTVTAHGTKTSTSYKTDHHTYTITAPVSIRTYYTTKHETSTVDVYPPHVTSTCTRTTTSWCTESYVPTTTCTETTTVTESVYTPTATVYAQCKDTGADRYKNPSAQADRGALGNAELPPHSDVFYCSASSPDACCTKCMHKDNCASSAYDIMTGKCELYLVDTTQTTCNAPGQYQLFVEYCRGPSRYYYYNGNCGTYSSAGHQIPS